MTSNTIIPVVKKNKDGDVDVPGDLTVAGNLAVTGNTTLAVGAITSGKWTPTISNTTNLDSTPTVNKAYYIRIGNIVMASVKAQVDATAGSSTATNFRITLPVTITADVSGSNYVAGSGTSNVGEALNVEVQSTTAATVAWLSSGTAATEINFNFAYAIV